MRVLYLGDIMGAPGRTLLARELEGIRSEYRPDVILAQAENVTHGKGMRVSHYHELKNLGIDGFMSGNHIFEQADLIPLLKDASSPVTRPANYPEGTPGMQYKYLESDTGTLLLITLLGQIVGKDADKPMENPLHVVDEILAQQQRADVVIVNFHGDYSSEKVVIGHYLDGRAAAVIGDHWHVPTADGRILPGGTAHISDIGMVGTLNSSLGIETDAIISRWRGDAQGRNVLAEAPPLQLCAALVEIDTTTGLARSIEPIVRYFD